MTNLKKNHEKKFKLPNVILFVGIVLISCGNKNESQLISNNDTASKFSNLKGPYLGQKPPNDVPKLFSPEVVADIYLGIYIFPELICDKLITKA